MRQSNHGDRRRSNRGVYQNYSGGGARRQSNQQIPGYRERQGNRSALVVGILIALLIGVGAGGVVVVRVSSALGYGSDTSSSESVAATDSAQQSTINLPCLADLITLDDAAILDAFADYSTYTISSEDTGMELVKLSSDTSTLDLVSAYATGIENLSADEATSLLNGAWFFTSARSSDATTIKVKYADFDSGDAETALAEVVAAEGLDTSTILESGTDDSGNTYESGTVEVDGITYYWKCAVCSLSSVYDIDGLAEDALYVGATLSTVELD